LSKFVSRPVVMGTHGMVTSTHYLASMAGLRILLKGGNAVDAGAVMWFALTVLEPWIVGVAGESPILIYVSEEDRVVAVNGQGPAPKAATIEWFKENNYELIPPDGFLPAVVPGALDAWILALSHYGTMKLEDVIEPAIELAAEGFPVTTNFERSVGRLERQFREEWPSSAQIYLAGGKPPKVGEIFVNPDLARSFKALAEAERKELKFGCQAGLEAARSYFYEGPIAEKIMEFIHSFRCRDTYGQEHYGLLTLEDFKEYRGRIEEPVSTDYRGYRVYKCGPWSQGPVFLQWLNLLEGFDLRAMRHNSVEYLHTLVECGKLAYADREEYYADPDFVSVPLETLLSKEYAGERRKLIDPKRASMELRPGMAKARMLKEGKDGEHSFDTVQLDVADRFGNMLSATPSGGWIPTSPLVPSLGFPLGTRGQMFHLDSAHAERLAPGRRPSTTLTPSLVTKNDAPYMVFGTPGGDQQEQWTIQLFLNYVEFGMDLQEALDAPLVHTTHFPSSFHPHAARPGEIHVEDRIGADVRDGLAAKGHKVVVSGGWSHGRCLAIQYDRESGVIHGAASPRTRTPYAMGW